MVVISPPLPALSADTLSLFHTTDSLLAGSHILIFYGPSATATAAANSSRIQAHIFSPTGLQSYPRLTISPSSPLYVAVECLPREEQGDEICRGLAFTLYKYFSELPAEVKDAWARQQPSTDASLPSAPQLFSEAHAAIVASHMLPVANSMEVVGDLRQALEEQSLSWVDLDVALPAGAMKELDRVRESTTFDDGEDEVASLRYGEYAHIVKLFGELDFLPTSKLRRAPSKPTAINRSLSFPRKQKETLRREMCELLDTEESYVGKVDDLVHNVAADFRQKAMAKSTGSASPSERALRGLFPPSLDQILEVNTGFLSAIEAVLHDTENDAIQDIEQTMDDGTAYANSKDAPHGDVTGTLALANCMLAWFPRFADCYAAYMQAHSDFSGLLRIFTKETGSSFSKRVQETGEQRLMSMLIEPVQRLPRYNLYIDNIVKQLPSKHPALKPLLKARDIVSEICSRDSPSSQLSRVVESLRRLVPSWPAQFRPQGRLISAVDVVELPPPFRAGANETDSKPGVLILFADCLVLLRKPPGCTKTARSLTAEIDNPNQAASEQDSGRPQAELKFHHRVKLSASHLSEIGNGSKFQLINLSSSSSSGSKRHGSRTPEPSPPRVFLLTGPYEGKASRWVEEVVKARVEGRFSELERDGHKWEVRTSAGADFNLFSAVFEDPSNAKIDGRKEPARIRVVVEPEKGTRTVGVGQDGVDIVASLFAVDGGFFRLEIEGLNNYGTRDHLTAAEFLPVLKKRLSNLLQMRYNIRNPAITAILLLRNQQILKSLKILAHDDGQDASPGRSHRPTSPVKMLTSLFGGTSKGSDLRKLTKSQSALAEIPRMMPPPSKPPSRDGSKPPSREGSKPPSREGWKPPSREGLKPREDAFGRATVGVSNGEGTGETLGKVEETLASYMLALHARKGNVVGKVLRGRASADEVAVNELYNILLEDPANLEAAAQVPVDVLFTAFEKFLRVAWKETMGPVMTGSTLSAIQAKSDSASQYDFEEYFRARFAEMSPQNQRALRAIIQLLADLLGGTANDSDRGILTASFAEVLVPDGKAHNFISLLDRFVEDVVSLFGRPGSSGQPSPMHGSMSSDVRSFSTVASSINSNTSSLRKKFGFGGLSRENSKLEPESKVGSVWRTLSKTGRGDPPPASTINKPTLGRSRSTDVDARISPKRPSSRDRPTAHGLFTFEESPSHGRSMLGGAALDTIGEVPHPNGPPRKKRRSSLSDLHALQGSDTPPTWASPVTPRKLDHVPRHTRQSSASPRTPTYGKSSRLPSPAYNSLRLGSPSRKENSPASSLPRPQTNAKTQLPHTRPEDVTITSHSPTKRRGETASSTPAAKTATNALIERPTAGNSAKPPPPSSTGDATEKPSAGSPTKRLRMQSPQKLRERLHTESKALSAADAALTAELTKIGDELASLNRAAPSPAAVRVTTSSPSTSALAARVKTLETTLAGLTSRNTTLAEDVATSLAVSEARARKLDELYREANAENEALYARFNDELARVAKAVRGGDGVEELRRRLREALEEGAVLRRENARLKRENVGLRAQVRE